MKYCEFLEKYRVYTANTETPEIIHLWVGLSTLAGACEKRLWIDRGYFKLYFNLYVAIVAPPGVCAKSSSINLGRDILKTVGFNVFEDSVLKEEIIKEMCELEKCVEFDGKQFFHSSITYIASELNVLLSSGVDMVKFLVNIWDKDDLLVYKTKNSGIYEVNHPFFNLISAAVPEWFSNNIASDMNSTGFLARIIIVYEDEKRKKVPDPTPTREQLQAKKEATEIIAQIGDMFGKVTLTKQAEKYYHDWYMAQDVDVTLDYRLTGYLERKVKTHSLKIAGLMAIGDDRTEIAVKDLERSIYLLDEIEPKLKLGLLLSGGNKLVPYIQRVKMFLDKPPHKINIKDLIRKFYSELSKEQFKEVLEFTEDLGYGKVVIESGKRYLVRV